MAGRRTTLTPDLLEAIVAAVRGGAAFVTAAEAANVSESTFHLWRAKGEKELARVEEVRHEGGEAEIDPRKAIYVTFSESLTRARAAKEVENIERLREIGRGGAVVQRTTTTRMGRDGTEVTETTERFSPPDPRPIMFELERSPYSRVRYGRHDKVELSGPDGGPIAISVKDELTALIEASARRLMGEPQQLVEAQALEVPPE